MTLKNRRRTLDICVTVFMVTAALLFLLPTVLTIANSFMTSGEISANYGTRRKLSKDGLRIAFMACET